MSPQAAWYSACWKRVIDVVVSGILLVLLSPLLILLAVAVRAVMGSPVLFRQERPGRHGVPFELAKFRTMRNESAPGGEQLSDAERLSKFGTWLRSTSLDELPELANVLLGKMSLVGPRPLLMEYLPRYSAEQARRHDVRPGITGWAQVNGRNALSWEEKFELDVWYVDHVSLKVDLRILVRTVSSVIVRSGINSEGEATAKPFEN
jgi:lipopolysaccharide/colanic/teichoic acid biosynthesis glycosyltransferase